MTVPEGFGFVGLDGLSLPDGDVEGITTGGVVVGVVGVAGAPGPPPPVSPGFATGLSGVDPGPPIRLDAGERTGGGVAVPVIAEASCPAADTGPVVAGVNGVALGDCGCGCPPFHVAAASLNA